jgi:mannose-6-phosphate isomerase-like protein (cupin superfamily)
LAFRSLDFEYFREVEPGHDSSALLSEREDWVMENKVTIAKEYAAEPVRYPALRVVNLMAEAAGVTESYRNMVINQVNGGCLRLAISNEIYAWHYHPTSDELFMVLEGCLAIDLEDGRELRVEPMEVVMVPAGTIHRTRAIGRTINLCFEELATRTIFVDGPAAVPPRPTE